MSPARKGDQGRQALLHYLLERDEARQEGRPPVVGPDPIIARALGDDAREVRELALQVAADDPALVTVDDLLALAADDDASVRARTMEVLAEMSDEAAVTQLAERVRLEDDDANLGLAVRTLARSVAANRPLTLSVATEVREALSELPAPVRHRHRYVVETLQRFLDRDIVDLRDAATLDPQADDESALADNLPDGLPNDLAIVLDEQVAGVEVVVPELFDALLAPPSEDRAAAQRALESLPPHAVAAWLRDRLAASAPPDLSDFARAVADLPIVDLTPELTDAAVALSGGVDRDHLVELLRSDERSWNRVADLQASPRADRRLDGLHLAVTLDPRATEPVRRALDDPVATVRLAATETITADADPQLFDVLAELLVDDSSPAVRLGAARPLTEAPRALRVTTARRALAGDDQAVRACAVGFLRDDGAEEVSLLAQGLTDASVEVVAVAARVLAQSHPTEAPAVLWEALRRASPDVHEAVLGGFDLLDRESLTAVVGEAFESAHTNERGLGVMLAARRDVGLDVSGLLHDALADPGVEVRLHALDALSRHLDVVAVDRVGERVRDPSPAVRMEALRLLRAVGDDRTFPYLLAAASDPADNVQTMAREVILEQGGAALVVHLVAALSDPVHRAAVAGLLVELGESALEPLLERLDDADPSTRKEIGSVLGVSGHLDRIEERLTHREPEQRRRAIAALGAAGVVAAAANIADRLTDPVPDVRREAVRVLADLGDPSALDPLRAALDSDPDLTLVAEVEEAIERLTKGDDPEQVIELRGDDAVGEYDR